MRIEWYYDFLSPFAYLASQRLDRLPAGTELMYRPVLFAGLLKHWEHKGPAEIPSKRVFTYRHAQWIAEREKIAFRFPGEHPFNPLPYLRQSIALGNSPEVVDRIFRFLWQTGAAPGDETTFERLCAELGVDNAAVLIGQEAVKQELHDNTALAIEAGVFGVPAWIVNDELFWGFDAMDFLIGYLQDPAILATPAMRRATETRVGVQRR